MPAHRRSRGRLARTAAASALLIGLSAVSAPAALADDNDTRYGPRPSSVGTEGELQEINADYHFGSWPECFGRYLTHVGLGDLVTPCESTGDQWKLTVLQVRVTL